MSWFARSILPIGILILSETFLLRKYLPIIYTPSSFNTHIERAYGLIVLINFIASSLLIIVLGFKVSAARAKCKEISQKNGDDKDYEARYSYPKMYAEGFSTTSNYFNCVQRGHQQALETYPQFLILSAIGGLHYPVSCAIGGIYWSIARWKWAEGYATGDPKNRYNGFFTVGVWTGLLLQLITATAVGCSLFL